MYGPRLPRPRIIEPFESYLRERIVKLPELSGARLLREIRALGYAGGGTALTDYLREIRPMHTPLFERRFETAPGEQAQADFAHFKVAFTDHPDEVRVVWRLRWSSVTAGICLRGSACTRICTVSFDFTCRPSSTLPGCRSTSCTIE
jgi:hypothetical protein